MRWCRASAPRCRTDANAWSSTSSQTSTSSSTSDGFGAPVIRSPASLARQAAGFVRLIHPFPVLVDAAAAGVIAAVAGGGAGTVAWLAAGMFLLQAAIGALNDVVDAPRDAGHKPGKPIPRGLVSRAAGVRLAAGAAVAGLAASAFAGPGPLAVGVAVLGVGALYDLRLKGSAWSWLPFAVGIPLLPVYAWLGATGSLPPVFALLVPAAILAGAGLAIANALADVDRDRAAGVASIASAIGTRRAWAVHAALHAIVVGLAGAGLALEGVPVVPGLATLALPGVALAAGVALVTSPKAATRERGWEVEAISVAVLGALWLAVIAPV